MKIKSVLTHFLTAVEADFFLCFVTEILLFHSLLGLGQTRHAFLVIRGFISKAWKRGS